jgi:hypothetical protein
MNSTASSFTVHKNPKRAAAKLIANGTAPAVDYGIRTAVGWNEQKGGSGARFRQLLGTVGVPKEARTSTKNQRTRNEVGHFFFCRFSHVFGMSVPPTRTWRSCP